MEQELNIDPQYLKGFNQGYVLAEHTPGIMAELLKNALPSNEYFSGFKAGNGEYTLEKSMNKMQDIAAHTLIQDKNKNKKR